MAKNAEEAAGRDLVVHEIRNQLSNITLAAAQLKHELPDLDPDVAFYLETISTGCVKIGDLLKKIKPK